MNDAIVYEVNLFVDAAIHAEFAAWLDAHVREILALPGFTGAESFLRREPAGDVGEVVFCTQYRLLDTAAFETYLREHAPSMRANGIARFGGRFRAERRVLAPIKAY